MQTLFTASKMGTMLPLVFALRIDPRAWRRAAAEGVFMENHSDTTKAASLIAGNLTTARYVRLMIAAFRGETDVDVTTAGTEVASTYSKILEALTSEQKASKS